MRQPLRGLSLLQCKPRVPLYRLLLEAINLQWAEAAAV